MYTFITNVYLKDICLFLLMKFTLTGHLGGYWPVKTVRRFRADHSERSLETRSNDLLGGGSSNMVYFHPYLGKCWNLTNIFQMDWNHQLECNPNFHLTPFFLMQVLLDLNILICNKWKLVFRKFFRFHRSVCWVVKNVGRNDIKAGGRMISKPRWGHLDLSLIDIHHVHLVSSISCQTFQLLLVTQKYQSLPLTTWGDPHSTASSCIGLHNTW